MVEENNPLNYENIKPEIAWDFNLPLPPYYKFIYLSNGSSASAASFTYFKESKVDVVPYWFLIRDKYLKDYTLLNTNKNGYNIISIYHRANFDKYIEPEKVSLLYRKRSY